MDGGAGNVMLGACGECAQETPLRDTILYVYVVYDRVVCERKHEKQVLEIYHISRVEE